MQCTIAKDIKGENGFWKTAVDKGWKAVLVAPADKEEFLETSTLEIAQEFRRKKFAFVCGSDVLSKRCHSYSTVYIIT